MVAVCQIAILIRLAVECKRQLALCGDGGDCDCVWRRLMRKVGKNELAKKGSADTPKNAGEKTDHESRRSFGSSE